MKTYILSLGIALMAFTFNAYAGGTDGSCCKKKSECCKNCSDECKTLCVKISEMTEEEKKSEEGKKLQAECAALCEKNGCCAADKGKACEHSKEKGKACCKK